jgi:hypothetical protein
MKKTSIKTNNFSILLENKYRDVLFNHSLYRSIIESSAFKRLEDIRFLGAIDYTFKPNQYKKRHTRYEHSLGVAELALAYAKNFHLNQQTTDHIVVAALLHDIGHAPLSHSVENVFYERFNLNHHLATIKIIKGDVKIGRGLSNTLSEYKMDVDRIIALIDGNENSLAGKAFSNPINIDTIDGIIRSSSYYSTPKLSTMAVLNALSDSSANATKILDSFWELKHKVYKNFIHSQKNLLADTISQAIAKKMKLEKEHFYISEKQYAKMFGSLYDQLKKEKELNKISYKKREYRINKNILYGTIEDASQRYICIKEKSILHMDFFMKKYRTEKLKGL